MPRFCRMLFLLALVMPAWTPVGAQTRSQDTRADRQALQQAPEPERNQRVYRASKIIGADVKDAQDKKLGEVRDLVLDSDRGEIAYLVVSFGGVMGAGGKYHALPWKALAPSDDGKSYVLRADRATVGKAPGFDRRHWPDMADQTWSAEVDRYWDSMVGQTPRNGISPNAGANSAAGTSGAKGASSRGEGGR
ncbi:PRC-barrel domain-containing protein [Noviherbaspirillum cavernae]|nr:PRC-barrel domain-containing protein [Noviherbaspirillum cavernae]